MASGVGATRKEEQRFLPVLLFAAILFAVYALIPTRNFYWDGVAFAIDIEKQIPAPQLVHPNHLLYAVAGRCAYAFFGARFRALFVMQALNAAAGVLATFLLFRLAHRETHSRPRALASALLFAFSATWWKFATDADAYIYSVCLLLVARSFLQSDREWFWFIAALAHSGAMLFHELSVLFLVVPIVLFARRPFRLGAYLAASLGPVALVYTVAYRLLPPERRMGGFFAWITYHAPDSRFIFNPFTGVALSLRGTMRLVLGGKPHDFQGDAVSWIALAGFVTLVFLLARELRTSRSVHLAHRALRFSDPEIAWLAVYLIFLFFWMPQNTFYRLFYLPPFVMLVARYAPARVLGPAAAAIALWNFVFLIHPQSKPSHNPPLAFALAMRSEWQAGTPVIFHKFHPDLWTISYFNPRVSWIGISDHSAAELAKWLGYAQREKKPLWIEGGSLRSRPG